jgi:hypothetical protein
MNALNEDNTLTETFVSQLYELDKTLAELKEQRENLVELIKKEMKLKEVKQIDHEHLVASIKAGYTKVNFDSTLLKQTHPELYKLFLKPLTVVNEVFELKWKIPYKPVDLRNVKAVLEVKTEELGD